jgi:hypothetical protein
VKPRNTRAHWWQVDMVEGWGDKWVCRYCGKRWTERLFVSRPGRLLRFVSKRWACPGPADVVSHGDEWDTYG